MQNFWTVENSTTLFPLGQAIWKPKVKSETPGNLAIFLIPVKLLKVRLNSQRYGCFPHFPLFLFQMKNCIFPKACDYPLIYRN